MNKLATLIEDFKGKEESEGSLLYRAYNNFGIHPLLRAKLFDWVLQVYLSFNKSSPKTIFLCFSIIDRFVLAKYSLKADYSISANKFHLVGLVAIWLASKLEDSRPILLS